jgi:UDP-N-acetylglucosamine 1-carboxyvinyltransferase
LSLKNKKQTKGDYLMEEYIIKGGKQLSGEVNISGAKNAALGILAASIMTDETVTINNLPNVSDINTVLESIQEIGGSVVRVDPHTVKINGGNIHNFIIDNEAISSIRGSYYFVGALLGKYKTATVPLPGGCNIGSRPIDQHIKGFKALGADIKIEYGAIVSQADTLKGCHIYFDTLSVGATINIMLAACLAEGETILENVEKEPYVVDVANILNKMGAHIKGAGTNIIRIKGVKKLSGCDYSIIPDYMEAGTFMFIAAATKSNILIKNIIPKHLGAISAKLTEIGVTIHEYDNDIRVISEKPLKATTVNTLPYPGFPTDMQAQIATLLTLSEGSSTVTENIFDSRFKYVDELYKMSANITIQGDTAIIKGVKKLTGATVLSPDLRGGVALVIAGLVADGFTTIRQIQYIERGYEAFEYKLQQLGADIAKVDSENQREIQKQKMKLG